MRRFRRIAVLGSLILLLCATCRTSRSAGPGLPAAAENASSAKAASGSPDLRPEFKRFGLKRRLQGERNTCSVFTVAAAMEYALAKKSGKIDSRLSIEYLNWASNQIKGHPQDGSCFSDLLEGFKAHGACPEADMPYQPEFDPARRPSADAVQRAKSLRDAGLHLHWIKRWNPDHGASARQIEQIKQVLAKGWPVCGGFLWPKSGLAEWKDGVLQLRVADEMRDGHSVLLVGWRDDPAQPGGGIFWIRNSSNGPKNETLSYAYLRAYMNDAVWVDDSEKQDPAEEPEPSPPDDCRPRRAPWWQK
jgi:C1A family cysteine protease